MLWSDQMELVKPLLAKLLSNRITPTSGTIEHGHNTLVSFYAQDVVDNLNLENDIITELYESDSENTIGHLQNIFLELSFLMAMKSLKKFKYFRAVKKVELA